MENSTKLGQQPAQANHMLTQDKLYIGVGAGVGVLVVVTLAAVTGALCCRRQLTGSGRRGRRLASTVSMAYSDFDTYQKFAPVSSAAASTLLTRTRQEQAKPANHSIANHSIANHDIATDSSSKTERPGQPLADPNPEKIVQGPAGCLSSDASGGEGGGARQEEGLKRNSGDFLLPRNSVHEIWKTPGSRGYDFL